MDVKTRKELFAEVYPLVQQGKVADKMTDSQYQKIADYADGIKNKYNRSRSVVDLVDSILALL